MVTGDLSGPSAVNLLSLTINSVPGIDMSDWSLLKCWNFVESLLIATDY